MKRKKTSRSDRSEDGKDNETSRWKYLAFAALFTFPGFIYGFEGLLAISKSFHVSMYVYVVFTATIAALIWLYFRSTTKRFYKYLLLIFLPLFLFPSLQVYTCSPVVLVNKDLGTKFKLATTAEEILQDCGQNCLKQFGKSLYSFSLISPQLTLQVIPGEVVDLNVTTNSESLKTSRIFIIFSLRSVRGKVHSLSLLTKAPFRSTKILEGLEQKRSMELTGRVVNIGRDLMQIKADLERNKLFVRPVVFEPYRVEINNDDEL